MTDLAQDYDRDTQRLGLVDDLGFDEHEADAHAHPDLAESANANTDRWRQTQIRALAYGIQQDERRMAKHHYAVMHLLRAAQALAEVDDE